MYIPAKWHERAVREWQSSKWGRTGRRAQETKEHKCPIQKDLIIEDETFCREPAGVLHAAAGWTYRRHGKYVSIAALSYVLDDPVDYRRRQDPL